MKLKKILPQDLQNLDMLKKLKIITFDEFLLKFKNLLEIENIGKKLC